MTIPAELHDKIAARLGGGDQRYSPLRRALVETMAAARRPLTIPEILQTNQGLSQSSAYRNITVLVDAGVARRVNGADDHGRFELAEHLSEHHHHLVCDKCGNVTDIRPSPSLERALADAAGAAYEEEGFAVSEHRIDLVGVCAGCT